MALAVLSRVIEHLPGEACKQQIMYVSN